MQRRLWLTMAVLALGMAFLGFYSSSLAAGRAAGGGPGDALPVPDGWQTLRPGQRAWYAFQYAGNSTPALVRLSLSPANSAAYAVWSPTDVARWARGEAANPTGRGSANSHYGGDLIWAGSSPLPGAWYVVVEPAGAAPTWFKLEVSGDGVSQAKTPALQQGRASLQPAALPSATPAPGQLQATHQPAPARPQATSYPPEGAATRDPALAYYNPATPTPTRPAQYPAQALPLPDGPQTLGVGEHTWYAFQYPGDRSRIAISLHADPPGSANFTVWSWDVLQRWWEGYYYTPTGRGTPSRVAGGDLTWYGGSIIKGKWYVVVEQNGPAPSTYTLQVSGSGVDRTLPPTAVPTARYALPLPTPGVYR